MKIAIDNLKNFFSAVDGDGDYSAVIEAENNQAVLYIYDRKNEKIIQALLLQDVTAVPCSIDVTWNENVCRITLPDQKWADFNTASGVGQVSADFTGNWITQW